jgi:hypothetical protein
VVLHTVVVVTGTVVGTFVGVVTVVVGVVLEEFPESSDSDGLVLGVSSDVVDVLFVEGTVDGVVTAGFDAPARNTTRTADNAPEPTSRPWVSRRTRANRRSRC